MTAALLIATVLLVFVNAFFVIAEYALVRARRPRIEAMVEEGARGADRVLAQLDHIGDYISACQVGITLTSIGIGALGEPTIQHLLEKPLGHPLSHTVAVVAAVVIAYILISSAQVTFGEMVPKMYAIQNAEDTARRIARPLGFFRRLFHPFIVALNATSNRVLRLLGTDPDAVDEGGSPDELKRIIAQSQTGGQIDAGEADMLTGVFHLHEQEARQVMTPIPAVVTVDLSETVQDALRRCVDTGHSRLVVTEDENQDRVKGIVHVNQLVKHMMRRGLESHFDELVREAPIVPETKPLDDLLADLQRERTELAIVIDEYGRTSGIVTTEDIIEEVVGEIADETDPAGGGIRRLANGDWFVRGHVAVADLENYGLEIEVGTDAYNSVGGYVFSELGRLPKRGDTVTADGYSIRVESVRQNRVEAVRIRGPRKSAPATSASE